MEYKYLLGNILPIPLFNSKVVSISPSDGDGVGHHIEILETTKFLSPIASVYLFNS